MIKVRQQIRIAGLRKMRVFFLLKRQGCRKAEGIKECPMNEVPNFSWMIPDPVRQNSQEQNENQA